MIETPQTKLASAEYFGGNLTNIIQTKKRQKEKKEKRYGLDFVL